MVPKGEDMEEDVPQGLLFVSGCLSLEPNPPPPPLDRSPSNVSVSASRLNHNLSGYGWFMPGVYVVTADPSCPPGAGVFNPFLSPLPC